MKVQAACYSIEAEKIANGKWKVYNLTGKIIVSEISVVSSKNLWMSPGGAACRSVPSVLPVTGYSRE